jgi:hypothetical protein
VDDDLRALMDQVFDAVVDARLDDETSVAEYREDGSVEIIFRNTEYLLTIREK